MTGWPYIITLIKQLLTK